MAVVKVSISYGEHRAEFQGDPDSVRAQLTGFLEKTVPAFALARKLLEAGEGVAVDVPTAPAEHLW